MYSRILSDKQIQRGMPMHVQKGKIAKTKGGGQRTPNSAILGDERRLFTIIVRRSTECDGMKMNLVRAKWEILVEWVSIDV